MHFPEHRHRARAGVVWDNHACMPLRTDESFLPQLSRYRAAGVDVLSINIGFGDMHWSDHLAILSFMRHWISKHSAHYSLITRTEDIHTCKAEGKLGIVFDVEGMSVISNRLDLVRTFYDLGVRWMLVTYNRNNSAGGGCLDDDCGLTAFGRAVIDEMEQLGMVLCLSHSGERTAMDALAYARRPVIFSHSNPFGHTAHPRNISDRLAQLCAKKRGVVGVSGIGMFLGGYTNVTERLLSQLRYLIDLVGPAHVGLGLDYVFDVNELAALVTSQPHLFPKGLDSNIGSAMVPPEAIESIADSLCRDNLPEDAVRGVLGENWLRVANEVWK